MPGIVFSHATETYQWMIERLNTVSAVPQIIVISQVIREYRLTLTIAHEPLGGLSKHSNQKSINASTLCAKLS